jgi:hypothetical protein
MGLRDFAYDAIVPLRGAPLWLVAIVTPLSGIAQAAGIFGLPLLLILVSWVWAYGYMMVEATAEGLPPPVLSIERTNPWHEPRAFVPLLVVLLAGWLGAGAPAAAGPTLALTAAAAGLVLLPAGLALLATGCGLGRALWPPALIAVVLGIGLRYIAVLALGAAYLAAIALAARTLPLILVGALGQVALYSFGAALGGSLYRRRHAVDLDVAVAPEHAIDRAAASASREGEAVASEIYMMLRVRRDDAAWQVAETWLGKTPTDPTPCRWLRDRAVAWGEPRFADRVGGLLVSRLVARSRFGEAIGAIEACWARNGRLAPHTAAESAALQAAATRMGHAATAARLADEAVQDTRR